MGLCKCYKKKVTNQYCFEHRVNVCENCMVSDHTKCVVQSYLQWLNDSNYSPVCQLCQEDLVSEECIRLVCYDVFHSACLDDWGKKMPPNTAPAGYNCPVCSSHIFPASNIVSPVADALRSSLKAFDWAHTGLGMPLVKSNSPTVANGQLGKPDSKLAGTHQNSSLSFDRGIPDGYDPTTNVVGPIEDFSVPILGSSQHRSSALVTTGDSRKSSDSSAIYINSTDEDTGDSKYKRRPTLEWFNRWIRTFQRPSSRHHQGLLGGRRRINFILAVIGIICLIVVVSYVTKIASNNDPMLDPMNNPNIRVEEK